LRVVSVVGDKGSGKTQLIEELIRRMVQRGLRVATVKCTHLERFDIEGRDTFRHRSMGAAATVGIGREETLIMLPKMRAREVLKRLPPVDVVLIEGCGEEPYPKVVVKPYSREVKGEVIAEWEKGADVGYVLERVLSAELRDRLIVEVDEREIPLNPFVRRVLREVIVAFLSSLKGFDREFGEVVIRIPGVRGEVEESTPRKPP